MRPDIQNYANPQTGFTCKNLCTAKVVNWEPVMSHVEFCWTLRIQRVPLSATMVWSGPLLYPLKSAFLLLFFFQRAKQDFQIKTQEQPSIQFWKQSIFCIFTCVLGHINTHSSEHTTVDFIECGNYPEVRKIWILSISRHKLFYRSIKIILPRGNYSTSRKWICKTD